MAMQSILKSALLISLALAGGIHAQEASTARIESVTVFTDRAAVRRVQSVTLSGSSRVIRFLDLPQAASADSIRAAGSGIEIASVSVRPAPRAEDPVLSSHPLKLQASEIEAQIRVESDRQANYREQLKVLSSFGQMGASQAERDLRQGTNAVGSFTDMLGFLERKRSDYLEKIQKSEMETVKLRAKLKSLNDQFARITASRQRSGIEVDVVCTGKPGATGTLSLEYTVTGVTWKGVYDLHGSSEGGEFRLDTTAAVRQNTGEDWQNVKLTLSTARPASGLSPNALKPWRITGSNLWTMNQDAKEDQAQRIPETSDGAAFTVTLPARETVLSDNSDHRITLESAQLKGAVEHFARPSVSSFVYLKAKLRNSTGMPLVWGSMNIFLDGSFAGTTVPSRAAAGEEFEVFMGADQRMSVKRTLLKGDITQAGLISSRVRIENKWQISITNHGRKPRRVVIQDQYPVSRDPAITTKLLESSRPLETDAGGILTGTVDAQPGQSASLDFTYSLEIPQELWKSFEETRPEPSPAEAPAPARQRRMYDLEQMLQH